MLKSPKKDTAIGPLIITCSFELTFHVMLRDPPFKTISAVGSVRLFLYAATNAAQAPVPQAKVFPAPLSQTVSNLSSAIRLYRTHPELDILDQRKIESPRNALHKCAIQQPQNSSHCLLSIRPYLLPSLSFDRFAFPIYD